ncbi:MAG: acyl-CoA dehydrogenase [Candidimonas sp.]|nr:MAG: acyl-CoA dehydrogenase [Candidimonas sp.]TAM20859.1 MAG: acyl-CoA dehydrogenase [Candidimonas sp.]TAM81294.1 MAG: acyl-CoA dehydrogenase [Candidimonas sp.]
MNNRPYGNELLHAARQALLDGLLPLLPADRTYDALMVANAMAIAARELESFGQAEDRDNHQIAQFYRDIGMDDSDASEAGLALKIRNRLIDKGHYQRLHSLLLAMAREKLAISNPKYLRK